MKRREPSHYTTQFDRPTPPVQTVLPHQFEPPYTPSSNPVTTAAAPAGPRFPPQRVTSPVMNLGGLPSSQTLNRYLRPF